MRKPTLRCCNTDTDLLLQAAMTDIPDTARYEIRPGELALEFVVEAIDAAVRRRFKGEGIGKRAHGELAALVFGMHDE